MKVESSTIILGIITFVTGGGLATLIRAIGNNRKIKAEAEQAGAKTQPEINQLTVGTLGEVIERLRQDNATLVQERDDYKNQLTEALQQIDGMRVELEQLQKRISALLEDADGKT